MVPKPVDQMTTAEIVAMRRKATEVADQAFKWIPGRVSILTTTFIRRAYREGILTKPIDELTDRELLALDHIGPKRLAEIRKAIATEQHTTEVS